MCVTLKCPEGVALLVAGRGGHHAMRKFWNATTCGDDGFHLSCNRSLCPPAFAQKNYAPGVSDTEIKIGQTIEPIAAFFAAIGRTISADCKMINEQGGMTVGRSVLSTSTVVTARPRRWSEPAA
jgi:hypothetical protein